MAIDAKDQITHGHIRRVQSYATGLAKTLGVTDAQQAPGDRGGRAPARHGQAGVPEHILNKPGKLTPPSTT